MAWGQIAGLALGGLGLYSANRQANTAAEAMERQSEIQDRILDTGSRYATQLDDLAIEVRDRIEQATSYLDGFGAAPTDSQFRVGVQDEERWLNDKLHRNVRDLLGDAGAALVDRGLGSSTLSDEAVDTAIAALVEGGIDNRRSAIDTTLQRFAGTNNLRNSALQEAQLIPTAVGNLTQNAANVATGGQANVLSAVANTASSAQDRAGRAATGAFSNLMDLARDTDFDDVARTIREAVT